MQTPRDKFSPNKPHADIHFTLKLRISFQAIFQSEAIYCLSCATLSLT